MLEKTNFGWHIVIPDQVRQSPDVLMSEVTRIIEELSVKKVRSVLYEINDPTTKLSGSDLVDISNLLASLKLDGLRIAVYSAQFNEHLTATFIENLMLSKKITTKYFKDKTAAINWLKSDNF